MQLPLTCLQWTVDMGLLIQLLALWPGLKHLKRDTFPLKAAPAIVSQLANLPGLTRLELLGPSFSKSTLNPLPSICRHLTRLPLQFVGRGVLPQEADWQRLSALTSLRSLQLGLGHVKAGSPCLQTVGVVWEIFQCACRVQIISHGCFIWVLA